MGILDIVGGGVELATEILKRSNTKEGRKYIDEYVQAKKALLKEKSKPMEDQYDNVVEHFEEKLKILLEAGRKEYVRKLGEQ